MKLKNNKGFTGVDVAISTVILIIFVSFIAILFYNISISTKQIERKSKASQLAIQVIEAMKMTSFDNLNNYGTKTGTEELEYQDVTQDEIKELTSQDITFENGYSVAIYVEDYNSQQIVKILGVKVSYPYVKDTIDTVEIKTLLKKEIIQSDETTTTKKPIVNTLKVGDYVYYEDGKGNTNKWRVLYDAEGENYSSYGIQIMSASAVEQVTLQGGIESYNNAIGILNRKASEYVNNEYATNGRCIGSLPDTIITEDNNGDSEPSQMLEYNEGIKVCSTMQYDNISADRKQIVIMNGGEIGEYDSLDPEYYTLLEELDLWWASRMRETYIRRNRTN